MTDPAVRPMLAELDHEYRTRYAQAASAEMHRYPPEEFDPPDGAVILLEEHGTAVAGGAFRRYNATTAEFKRIWTSSRHRRRGLARRVLAELEAEAARRGYQRVHLTTGPRQPEAHALYLATGYTPRYDRSLPPEVVGIHPFDKPLAPRPHTPGRHHPDKERPR
ncbi:GNAT family N-acetyltransferase [Allostreptomyces psammosilenae]|nr:GNAT family N-acetyltransferase [Allostreptomyces psammosilenae]